MPDRRTEVLASLLLHLNLEDSASVASSDGESGGGGLRSILGKKHRAHYKFIAKDAVKVLASSEFQKSTKSRRAMDKEEALRLVHEFVLARLLHCPADRTLMRPGLNIELQPTAKGIAVLAEEVQRLGIDPNAVPILCSPYNTLTLLYLERSPATGKLQLSGSVAMMVWYYMLGLRPQIFLRTGQSQSISDTATVTSDVSYVSEQPTDTSPYFHKYFIHPSTNSVSQYWNNDGVRLFNNLVFKDGQQIDYTLTGKAIWQWILECTTVQSPAEATQLARLVLAEGFTFRVPCKVADSVTCSDDMPEDLSREAFYMFTHQGRRVCRWGELISDSSESLGLEDGLAGHECALKVDRAGANAAPWPRGSSFSDMLTLSQVFREPGLKMLYRQKLKDWHCEESLMLLDEFSAYILWREALAIAMRQDDKFSSTRLTERTVLALKSINYGFIKVNAPYEVNISSILRDQLLEAIGRLRLGKVSVAELQGRLDEVVEPLDAVITHISELLSSMIPRFASSEELAQLPFRNYVS